MIHRNKKMLTAAKDRDCIRCGAKDGTVVRAHYCGLGQQRLGKGRGIKPHDFASACLCRTCHEQFDGYAQPNDYERAWEFLLLCLLEIERDFEQGVIA